MPVLLGCWLQRNFSHHNKRSSFALLVCCPSFQKWERPTQAAIQESSISEKNLGFLKSKIPADFKVGFLNGNVSIELPHYTFQKKICHNFVSNFILNFENSSPILMHCYCCFLDFVFLMALCIFRKILVFPKWAQSKKIKICYVSFENELKIKLYVRWSYPVSSDLVRFR